MAGGYARHVKKKKNAEKKSRQSNTTKVNRLTLTGTPKYAIITK